MLLRISQQNTRNIIFNSVDSLTEYHKTA